MGRLKAGYILSGLATGLILFVSFLWTLPDGKLRIVFCDVGQGDAAYVRFPDGRDMLVDGGPNDRVLGCLGNHMPFWDRHIDIVLMTHPQKDHMQGLISVFERFDVDYFVRSDIDNTTEGYAKLTEVVGRKKVPVRYAVQGERIDIGDTSLAMLWPSGEQIAKGKSARRPLTDLQGEALQKNVLGSSAVGDLNDYSLVFSLRYGSFDAVFTGDADSRIESRYVGMKLSGDPIEVLKVPHHGSKTGMTSTFIEWIRPQLAVISVGKNSYGHPAETTLQLLSREQVRVLRTDQEGDILVVSDGTSWKVGEE